MSELNVISKFKNITYVKGDATTPNVEGKKIIPHICNDIGKWGAGFVMALSNKWSEPEAEYRKWYNDIRKDGKNYLPLGEIQLVPVEDDIMIANIIGQHKTQTEYKKEGKPNTKPLVYAAVIDGLKKVNNIAQANKATIHMPKIGCGLAGGDWNVIENIIVQTINPDVKVFVYIF